MMNKQNSTSPLVIRPAPGAAVCQHHSTEDWDYGNQACWSLDTADFITSPSSLRRINCTPDEKVALLKLSSLRGIDQGMMASYFRYYPKSYPSHGFIFRSQVPISFASLKSCYAGLFSSSVFYWYYYDANGAQTTVGSFAFAPLAGNWKHLRILWWNGRNIFSTPATVVRLQEDVSGVWTKRGVDLYDTNQRYKGSSDSRVGLFAYFSGDWPLVHIDNTEIWKA